MSHLDIFWRLISKGQWFWYFLPLLLFFKFQTQQKYPSSLPNLKPAAMFFILLLVLPLSCSFNSVFSFWNFQYLFAFLFNGKFFISNLKKKLIYDSSLNYYLLLPLTTMLLEKCSIFAIFFCQIYAAQTVLSLSFWKWS